jgi:hypothetical protein
MGSFSERLFAVFLVAMPWRRNETSCCEGQNGHNVGREHNAPTPTWQTWDMQSPTTSTLRADLEALRTYTRVR